MHRIYMHLYSSGKRQSVAQRSPTCSFVKKMANNGVEHVFGDKSLNPSFKDSLCTSGEVGSPSIHH